MQYAHLAVVMPAYNEAEGIGGFIDEIRAAVAPLAERVTFIVADDRSTDPTAAVLSGIADVDVQTQPTAEFVEVVQRRVDDFLTACATQQVLQPTGCPFGLVVQNRIISEPI